MRWEINENLDFSRLVCHLVQRFTRHQRVTSYWLSSAVWSRSSLSYVATQDLLTFRDDLSVPISRELQPKKDCLTTEDGTDMLSRNVCKQLPTKAAWQPKKSENLRASYVTVTWQWRVEMNQLIPQVSWSLASHRNVELLQTHLLTKSSKWQWR